MPRDVPRGFGRFGWMQRGNGAQKFEGTTEVHRRRECAPPPRVQSVVGTSSLQSGSPLPVARAERRAARERLA